MPLSRCHDFVPVTGWSIYLEVAGSSPSHAILYVVNFVRPLIMAASKYFSPARLQHNINVGDLVE